METRKSHLFTQMLYYCLSKQLLFYFFNLADLQVVLTLVVGLQKTL